MDEMEKDLAYVREQLSQLKEPELPPALTAAALFARLDEGTLHLPEEETPAPGEEKQNETAAAIPWRKLAKRWLPLAACLAIVLLLHQGYQVGLARNFNGSSAPMASSAPAAEAAPQTPELAMYSAEDAAVEEEPSAESAAQEAPADGAAENGRLKSALTASAAPPPPAPEPAPAPALPAEPETSGGSDADSVPPENTEKPNPPTGGGGIEDGADPDPGEDMHPDTGGGDEPSNPDFGVTDSGEEGPSLYKQLKGQMEEIAAGNSPDETLTCDVTSSHWPDDGKTLEFTARYLEDVGGKRVERAQRTFYCRIHQAEEGPWLELLYFEEKVS